MVDDFVRQLMGIGLFYMIYTVNKDWELEYMQKHSLTGPNEDLSHLEQRVQPSEEKSSLRGRIWRWREERLTRFTRKLDKQRVPPNYYSELLMQHWSIKFEQGSLAYALAELTSFPTFKAMYRGLRG